MCRCRTSALFLLVHCVYLVQYCHSVPSWGNWLLHIKTRRQPAPFSSPKGFRALLLRAGSSNEESDSEDEALKATNEAAPDPGVSRPKNSIIKRIKYRHTYDMVLELHKRSGVLGNYESSELRELISKRSKEYLADLREAVDANESKLPHPKKLLHYLAPKVPAIKQSPDVNLRIHSARSDIDSGVAACIIGTLAHVCEIYDKEKRKKLETDDIIQSVAPELTTDRRFEQLVECVLNGVNVQKRKKQSLTRQLEKNSEEAADIEQILDEEDAQVDEGLNVRDACRAAWGISVLGCSHLEILGDVKILDLLLALSLRIRELLLARLQLLRQDDLFSDPATAQLSTEERLNEVAEELAEDAATSIWTFACVKACTGMRSVPLFETCCSILCQDPVDLRSRAQAADYEPGVPIGTNDIIDRLAHSEKVDGPLSSGDDDTNEVLVEEVEAGKDALLDWLSPTEVNDVLWAIALHGSNSTYASDEVTLSETASALKEIAFDRMIEWLEHDIMLSELVAREAANEYIVIDDSSVTVEVVDAAALLASHQEISKIAELPDETIPVTTVPVKADGGLHEVEVVDAATLLASMGGEEIETEVIVATPSVEQSFTVHSEDISNDIAPRRQEVDEGCVGERSQIFSPHDLATMAWSVTELRDPLRVHIVGMVLARIEKLGIEGTTRLSGGDLANLAWGVSRYEHTLSEKDSDRSGVLATSVLSWIAQNALQKSSKGRSTGRTKTHRRNLLESFQPPELGRLNWAIANTFSLYSSMPRKIKANAQCMELARLSLEAAASNLELFAPEDLLRISWAFLEICKDEPSMITLTVADALGSILATVEHSLHRWERGTVPSSLNQASEASVFSSFFGKPRLNHQLLEHMLNDGEDDDESALGPLLEKSRKPLLRDLSVDPSTLCRAACAFQRLSKSHPYMKGGWTLTRVAVRLLSSKNARLMKECSIHDIVRLCEATVLCEADGHGRELITGLFARKVLQVLNESLDSASEESSIDVSMASASELSSLLWSLGELGAKHHQIDDARHSAYKRMRLVSEVSLLSQDQVKSLDCSSTLKLFRGTVLMNFISSDKLFLHFVLHEIRTKVKHLKNSGEMCSLAESVAILKEGLKPGKASAQPDTAKDSKLAKGATENSKDESANSELPSAEERSSALDESVIEEQMLQSCEIILESIGAKARGMLGSLSAEEIRRLLAVYSLLPFQDDALIDDIFEEVTIRKSHLQQSPNDSIENILPSPNTTALSLNATELGSPFDNIKNGIMSFFSTSDDADSKDNIDSNSATEEMTTSIEDPTATMSKAAKSVNDLHAASGISMDSVFQNIQKGAAFELGRCDELIENYRRIEFSTGTVRSRYDKERRKEIAKRVLGRLLP